MNGFSLVSNPGQLRRTPAVDPNGTYGCAHGAPNVQFVESPGRNGYRSGPLRPDPVSGVMEMASVTPSPLEKEEWTLEGKEDLRRAEGGTFSKR